jgi:ParB-like chromosome segregation protein Spo0J
MIRTKYNQANSLSILHKFNTILKDLQKLNQKKKIKVINKLKIKLHQISPFKDEPTDCVLWIENEKIYANDYNPNAVAPPEMKLLELSISEDGFTQPIVTMKKDNENNREVIDGFHRNRIAKESMIIKSRLFGYSPVVTIRDTQIDRSNRIAATIRHNRARGKHQVTAMSDIVIELKKRNWTNPRISKELGMDEDEVLRLCQISGLEEVFSDTDFSQAWDINIFEEADLDLITEEDIKEDIKEENKTNDNKEKRIYHTWDKWECYKAGFYENQPPKGLSKEECEIKYKNLLSDLDEFEDCLKKIIKEWKYSCEHYLSNPNMNRIAWLGQAALAYKYNIPACFRGGYNLLTEEQKLAADKMALKYLNIWRKKRGLSSLSYEEAQSKTEPNLY